MSCPDLAQTWAIAGALDSGSGGCALVVVVAVDALTWWDLTLLRPDYFDGGAKSIVDCLNFD